MADTTDPTVESPAARAVGALVGGIVGLGLATWDVKRHKGIGPDNLYEALSLVGGAAIGYMIGGGLSSKPNPAYVFPTPATQA